MKYAALVAAALVGFAALPKLVDYMAGSVVSTLAVVAVCMFACVTVVLQDLRR